MPPSAVTATSELELTSSIEQFRSGDGYELPSPLKAAVLLLALPEDKSCEVLRRLDPEQAEQIALQAATLDYLPGEAIKQVVVEFQEYIERYRFVRGGGVKRIQDLLGRALPRDVADKITARVLAEHQPPPFRTLATASITQAVEFLRNEHPQTIALVLAHVQKDIAAQILGELEEEQMTDVAYRLLTIDTTPPDVLQALDDQIRIRMAPTEDEMRREHRIDGVKRLVDILNASARGVEQQVLSRLEELDPDLYGEIRKAMFVFEDLLMLDGRSVQRLLREIDTSDLALALKGSSEELNELFLKNMSQRAALIFKEDMQFMGAVRARDVQEAQQRIINAARNLEAAGELVIPRGGQDALIG
ncbi:MAG: flagellar motor switch protein FliG [Fimbriimonadaceae bacterium]|nr:flagellar motor switch protein FliG [Fimbriimonadaceae bacterium]